MRINLIILMAVVFLAGCSGTTTDITPDQLNSMLESEDIFLVDVHIPEQQHIEGTDAVIPFNEITEHVKEIPDDKKIVVYCRSGSMSEEASKALADEGYEVYNLLGGANAWRSEGYEFEVKE